MDGSGRLGILDPPLVGSGYSAKIVGERFRKEAQPL